MKKAVVFNLGCKVNQYECDVLAAELLEKGFEVSDSLIPADVYIINTCAVTAEAERKSRQILSRIRKLNSNAYIMVCGCASEKNAAFYKENGVQFVTGVAKKGGLTARIGEHYAEVEKLPQKYEDTTTLPAANRTRAYVKIQDGCDNFCSYCLIPYLRGRSRSRDIQAAAEEIRALSNKTEEIVITGINLSQYGKENNENLAMLINDLKDVPARIRLGSFYVEGVNNELLDALFRLEHFCPHFHLSLQNGDDTVLKAMNRRYTAEEYLKKIDLIKTYDKNAAITTDIITGFPAENDAAFQNNLTFIRRAAFSDIHIFPFSQRAGTAAARMKPIPTETVKERKHILEAEREILRASYLNKMLHVNQSVLFESGEGEIKDGYSEYYIRFYVKGGCGVKTVKPMEIYKDGLKGEMING